MDVSSELVHSVLPVFLTTVLGVSLIGVGLIEGFAEGLASILKVFSGALSDKLRRRKPVVLVGYALSTLTKPFFPLATGATEIIAARFLDRIGKGIRGAPRDALIADVTPEPQRAAAYGLRQSLDSIGAFVGPILAVVLLWLWSQNIRATLWIAVIPALLCVLCIVFWVREPSVRVADATKSVPLTWASFRRLPGGYWWIVAFASVLTLARFSDAFLILRAQSLGLSLTWIPAVMIVMNIVYALIAAPAGAATERIGRDTLLFVGLLALIGADVVLALAWQPSLVFVGTALWGLHMGLTQGLLSTIVAQHAPADLRGTAFGVFNLVTGLFVFVASTLAGALWHFLGPAMTFYAGVMFTIVAGVGLMLSRNDRN